MSNESIVEMFTRHLEELNKLTELHERQKEAECAYTNGEKFPSIDPMKTLGKNEIFFSKMTALQLYQQRELNILMYRHSIEINLMKVSQNDLKW